MLIKSLERVCFKWLDLQAEPYFIKTFMGAYFANHLDTVPIWLMFVGPPSSGKSEITGMLNKHFSIEPVAKVTSKSLASGINPNSKEWKGQPDPSLFARLDNKVMVIRDGSSIITMPAQFRDEFMSDLRTAYDGEFESHTGLGKKVYKCKFGIVISVTEEFEKDNRFNAQLGERFLKFRPESPMDSDKLKAMIDRSANELSVMREEISTKANKFVDGMKERIKICSWNKLWDYAGLLAELRSVVPRNKKGEITALPRPEGKARLYKQLTALYSGLVYVSNELEGQRIIRRITRDSIPLDRIRIMELVFSGYNTVTKIKDQSGMSPGPIASTISDLRVVGAISSVESGDMREKRVKVNYPYAQLFGVCPLI